MRTLFAAVLTASICSSVAAQVGSPDDLKRVKDIEKEAFEAAHHRTYDFGQIFVIERDDAAGPGTKYAAYLIDAVSVITSSKEKRDEFQALLKASKLTPGVPLQSDFSDLDLNTANVTTMTEYFDNMAKQQEKDRSEYKKKNPGKSYPFDGDTSELRSELEAALKGREAVVLRYIHIKRDSEKH